VKNSKGNPTDYYALKCIAKNQILEQNLQKHLLVEKKSFFVDFIEKIARKRSHGKAQFPIHYAFFSFL